MLGKQAGLGRAGSFSGGKEGASLEPIHRRVGQAGRTELQETPAGRCWKSAEKLPGRAEDMYFPGILLSVGIPLRQEKVTCSRWLWFQLVLGRIQNWNRQAPRVGLKNNLSLCKALPTFLICHLQKNKSEKSKRGNWESMCVRCLFFSPPASLLTGRGPCTSCSGCCGPTCSNSRASQRAATEPEP